MRPILLLLLAGAAMTASGCFDGIVTAEDIRCADQAECPVGYSCIVAIGRCVAADSRDRDDPDVVDPAVDPPLARRGTTVIATFGVTEALLVPPVVTIGGTAVLVLDDPDPDALSYSARRVLDGSEAQGDAVTVLVDLVDRAGNASRVGLGTVRIDLRDPVCGDAIVDNGEGCDDGNTLDDDDCVAGCVPATCGDGFVHADPARETCDDANDNRGDGCDSCRVSTWTATLLLGTGPEGTDATAFVLSHPEGIATDRDGVLYVMDTFGGRVVRVDAGGARDVAGSGGDGFGGDGGPATAATFSLATDVAVDGLGNLFIADQFNQRVRRVSPDGVMSTLAGNGGFSDFEAVPDGTPALEASIDLPLVVIVDGGGRVFIGASARVLVVELDGTITTVAGSDDFGFNGDGGPATSAALGFVQGLALAVDGTLYIADSEHRVRRVDVDGTIHTAAGNGSAGGAGDNGLGVAAELDNPSGLALADDGTLFIAEEDGRRVRRLKPDGVIDTVIADGGGTRFSCTTGDIALLSPTDVALHPDGALDIVDSVAHRVCRLEADGTARVVAGNGRDALDGDGGPARSAPLRFPSDVAVDGEGRVVFADNTAGRVQRIEPDGTVRTLAGGGAGAFAAGLPARSVDLDFVVAVDLLPDGRPVLRAAVEEELLLTLEADGTLAVLAGGGTLTGDGAPALETSLEGVFDVAVDARGRVVFVERTRSRVRRLEADGTVVTVVGTGEPGDDGDDGPATAARLTSPRGIAIAPDGTLCVCDDDAHRVRCVDGDGFIRGVAGIGFSSTEGEDGPAAGAGLSTPGALAFDGSGRLYISEFAGRLLRVDEDGVLRVVARSRSEAFDDTLNLDGGPVELADLDFGEGFLVRPDGAILFADENRHAIRQIANGVITTLAGPVDPPGMGVFSRARLAAPTAIATLDDRQTLVVGAGRVQRVIDGEDVVDVVASFRGGRETTATPIPAHLAGLLDDVAGVAFDAALGRVWLSERGADRLLVMELVDPTAPSTWTLAAVTDGGGYRDGALDDAAFNAPAGLLFDDARRVLFVADSGNHVIRAVDVDGGLVSTVAGTPRTRGFAGDEGPAGGALLFAPSALARGRDGSLFIADTGNHRVRRVLDGVITTVLGDGSASSAGEGSPARAFPVDSPAGVTVDADGNLLVSSRTAIRLVTARDGVVDGGGAVLTPYGRSPRVGFPVEATQCLAAVATRGDVIRVFDACVGYVVELRRSQP